MKITNEQTGVTYYTKISKRGDQYETTIYREQQNPFHRMVTFHDVLPVNRHKAYRVACAVAHHQATEIQ